MCGGGEVMKKAKKSPKLYLGSEEVGIRLEKPSESDVDRWRRDFWGMEEGQELSSVSGQ